MRFHVRSHKSDFTSNNVLIKPDTNLTWLGNLLTPELRAMSRWAYVNTTFLETGVNNSVAVTCVLYPCLRTYTASIVNNRLSEKLGNTEVMQVDMKNQTAWDVEDMRRSKNAGSNYQHNYTTIKSPCRVNGDLYDTRNMSLYAGATELSLFDFTAQGVSGSLPYTSLNITAPEQCIYRHNQLFVFAISGVFREEIFDGYCGTRSSLRLNCFKNQKDAKKTTDGGTYSNLGASSALLALTYKDTAKVIRWFDSFADSMTNRFRLDYSATDFKTANKSLPTYAGNRTALPPGQTKGVAWRSTTCVSIHWQWLLLPISLTLVATLW
jgi:hypothetical protein